MKLSIITINLNNAAGFLNTIKSVINQSFSDYEYIIIDGGSTDSSVEVIKEFADGITFWVSEPDKGIYNAMNKGILLANGEYCMFLNSGDYFVNSQVLQDIFKNQFSEDIIFGNVVDGNTLKLVNYPENYTLYSLLVTTIPHNASLIKRSLFHKYGWYNELYKIASDWEFWIKTIIIHNCTYKKINLTISFLGSGGISSDMSEANPCRDEGKVILESFFPIRVLEDYSFLTQTKLIESYPLINWIRSNTIIYKILRLLYRIRIKR